ncbi:hypothetical protein ABPG77_007378 [Micractinium sp. CCAP 211/92]
MALVAALLCVSLGLVASQSISCPVTELDGSTKVFTLDRFDPAAATSQLGSRPSASDCPSPQQVPAGSKAPYILGTATAAYQVEGNVKAGRRGESIWDVFSHTPSKTFQGQTGDTAVDFYNRYKDDVALMRTLGLRNFRFSLSWTRIFPNGTGAVNQEGVDFYNKLIDSLKAACIEPHITLYHWDFPQALYQQYGGWIDPRVVVDFTAYAETAFELFGDRVKNWYTLNEPETYCALGYLSGVHAPGRCTDRSRCSAGEEGEDLKCIYYSALAHASAVRVFRQLVPDGTIAMTNAIGMNVPYNASSPDDVAAALRNQAFSGGLVLDPVYTGDWGTERKQVHGKDLPAFTPDQKALLLENQQDFVALQHYTSSYAYYNKDKPPLYVDTTTKSIDGVQLVQADSPWLCVFPSAMRDLLNWLSQRYNASILITENGVSAPGEYDKPRSEVLCDQFRLSYFQQYISNATAAVQQDGVNLIGYFAWSLLDNFEWADGYSKRFGTVYVDYSSPNLDRYYKGSSMWLSNHFGLTSIRSAPSANDTCSTSSPPSPPAAAEPPAGAPGGAPAPAGGQPGRSPPPARDERTGS